MRCTMQVRDDQTTTTKGPRTESRDYFIYVCEGRLAGGFGVPGIKGGVGGGRG